LTVLLVLLFESFTLKLDIRELAVILGNKLRKLPPHSRTINNLMRLHPLVTILLALVASNSEVGDSLTISHKLKVNIGDDEPSTGSLRKRHNATLSKRQPNP